MEENEMTYDEAKEEHRKDISERRTRVFPRRMRKIDRGEPDQRSGEERRKGDRRGHKEDKG
jgi:hypothetical protein